MNAKLLFLHALSPLHPGTGQGVGVIDLPIAREVATGLPYLPGSSLKGVLRDRCSQPDSGFTATRCREVFGPDTANASDHAGSLQVTDQRLLLFPARSLKGTFAWLTSPFVLHRLSRDGKGAGLEGLPAVPAVAEVEQCLVGANSALVHSGKVFLEDLDLSSSQSEACERWATWLAARLFPREEVWRRMLAARLCIVHDDLLSYLLSTATEVIARIRMSEESKTVEQGGLWYEEALPAETVLSGMVVATPIRATVDEVFNMVRSLVRRPVQVGGSATVGRGFCQLRLVEGGAS